MSDKETNLKEKFRLALTSTAKVISDDFEFNKKYSENKKSKDLNTIEIDNLKIQVILLDCVQKQTQML